MATQDVIDVSLLPDPTLLDTSYERIRTARLASLKARFNAVGIDWDVDALETDPGVILQEEDAYRQMLDIASINDAVKRVLAAWAKGADLDQLCALNGTVRLVATPADPITGTPAIMESDPNLLLRFLASFSKPAAGSRWGYIAQVRTTYPRVRDVAAYVSEFMGRPRINVVILGPGGEEPPEVLTACNRACRADDRTPLTADISVRWATITRWSIQGVVEVGKGPSAEAVAAQAKAAVALVGNSRFRVGGSVPQNLPGGTLYVPNVISAALTVPFLGIPAVPDAAPMFDAAASSVVPYQNPDE